MTYTFTADIPAQPVPGQLVTQKFGRIEQVRPTLEGSEVDIRQPNGGLLVVVLDGESLDTGVSATRIGRNIWVSGYLDGDRMRVDAFSVYAEEL